MEGKGPGILSVSWIEFPFIFMPQKDVIFSGFILTGKQLRRTLLHTYVIWLQKRTLSNIQRVQDCVFLVRIIGNFHEHMPVLRLSRWSTLSVLCFCSIF